jgi:hypothetical protein
LLIEEIEMLKFEKCTDITGTCLRGYVTAKYSDLVHAFGKPDWVDYDPEEKVSHEWGLIFTDAGGETVRATVYAWKYYDGGIAVESDVPIRWNVGGDSGSATMFVNSALRGRGND